MPDCMLLLKGFDTAEKHRVKIIVCIAAVHGSGTVIMHSMFSTLVMRVGIASLQIMDSIYKR